MPTHAGHKVLITGGASGIGWCMAQHFVAAGAQVFIADADDGALAQALTSQPNIGGKVVDLKNPEQVEATVRQAASHMQGLSVLVNCAGTAGPTADVEDMAFQEWRDCLAVNLDAAFLCAHHAIPLLKANGGGCILNLSSTAGLYAFARRAPYAAAKWALRGFTRTLAQELGPHRIRVNCICPGSVAGPRIEAVMEREAKATGQSLESVRQRYQNVNSLRSFVTADDVAQAALFLSSNAGKNISGIDFVIDGHTETF